MNEKQLKKWAKKMGATKDILDQVAVAIQVCKDDQMINCKPNEYVKITIHIEDKGVSVIGVPTPRS